MLGVNVMGLASLLKISGSVLKLVRILLLFFFIVLRRPFSQFNQFREIFLLNYTIYYFFNALIHLYLTQDVWELSSLWFSDLLS